MIPPFGFVDKKYAVITKPSFLDTSRYTATSHFFFPKLFAALKLPPFPQTIMSGFSTVSRVS